MSISLNDAEGLVAQAAALLADERDRVANAANLSSLVYHAFDDVNWVGFYFASGEELVVGPFQGKPACVRIPFGRGVCGKAAASRETLRVADVHAFDDHIVCDVESRSEIVVPLVKSGAVIGVLDIDSPRPNRFSEADQAMLEEIASVYVESIG